MADRKHCKDCDQTKYLGEYYSYIKQKADGTKFTYYHPICKNCTKAKSMKWKKDNPDKLKKSVRKYNSKEDRRKKVIGMNTIRRNNGEYNKWLVNNKDKVRKYRKYRNMHKKHEISKQEWESCKSYFNNECGYCGIHLDNHFKRYRNENKKMDFHKEHVNHDGANDLSNCIPSCHSCNSSKYNFKLEDWYRNRKFFTEQRLLKIYKWLKEDYLKYIEIDLQ